MSEQPDGVETDPTRPDDDEGAGHDQPVEGGRETVDEAIDESE